MKKVFILVLFLGMSVVLYGCSTITEKGNEKTKSVPISEDIVKKIVETKIIIVKEHINNNVVLTINDYDEVKQMIAIISKATKIIEDDVEYLGAQYNLEMFNINGELIDIVEVFVSIENVGFQSDRYNRYNLDMKTLLKIIEN